MSDPASGTVLEFNGQTWKGTNLISHGNHVNTSQNSNIKPTARIWPHSFLFAPLCSRFFSLNLLVIVWLGTLPDCFFVENLDSYHEVATRTNMCDTWSSEKHREANNHDGKQWLLLGSPQQIDFPTGFLKRSSPQMHIVFKNFFFFQIFSFLKVDYLYSNGCCVFLWNRFTRAHWAPVSEPSN